MTIAQAVAAARDHLTSAAIPEAEAAFDAELLARHALDVDRATFVTRMREPANEAWLQRLSTMIERRAAREPVAYIRGVQEFWGREFTVSHDVLIPRPETELLVERALALIDRHPPGPLAVLDVGTGSGCLAITLALERPALQVFAIESSAEALDVAAANAWHHEVAGRITFIHGRYFDGIFAPLDLIVANPPYVAEGDAGRLPIEVQYEPAQALFGGRDGLEHVRVILAEAATRLIVGGTLLLEIGAGQGEAVAALAGGHVGLRLHEIVPDLQGIPRMAVVERTA